MRQAEQFDRLAPNMIVKIPATQRRHRGHRGSDGAGHHRSTRRVCFTLPQCVAVAEADRARAGDDGRRWATTSSTMGPVCTIMVGRLDDWLKVGDGAKKAIATDPGHLEWAGVAVFKKTYRLFRERGYRVAAAVGRLPQSHALERARSAATS